MIWRLATANLTRHKPQYDQTKRNAENPRSNVFQFCSPRLFHWQLESQSLPRRAKFIFTNLDGSPSRFGANEFAFQN